MKKYLLKEDNCITHIFTETKENNGYYIEGKLEEVVSWDSTMEPHETNFLAELCVKWDGCSHWYFKGEDYDDEYNTDADSYYHLCGIHSYISFMKGMLFVFETASLMYNFDPVEKSAFKEYKNLLGEHEIIVKEI